MDKDTYEIIRNGLYAVAREMKIAMMRTAASPIIHSGGDVSAAIFDAELQLVAQGNDIPTMLGSAVVSTRAMVEAVRVDNLEPGDVIVANDAYLAGGNHQPDVQFTRPVFNGGVIVGYTMTRGHWSDIGGQSPGSYAPVTWDIFGEGIRIPPVRLFRRDEVVPDVMTLIIQNTRDPANRELDIQAQYAGTVVGERRLLALAEKYGTGAVADTMREALDYSERLMRVELERIPDGVYEAEDVIEPVTVPGWPDALIPIRVRIEVAGDSVSVDYAGSGDQVRGGVNCPLAVTLNSTWFTFKAVTDPAIPINQGCYRPIAVSAPEGSILNCRLPASVVSGNTETSPRVIDLLLSALAPAIPERVIAQSYDTAATAVFGGYDPVQSRRTALGRDYVGAIDVHGGGLGARPDKDGVSAIRVHVGNVGSQSVEQIEFSSPLTVEEWSLVPDSGGAGRWRGGLSARRVYRVEFDEASLSTNGERGRIAPAGLFGGTAGSLMANEIRHAEGRIEPLPAKAPPRTVRAGNRVVIQPAGSGGYGDSLEREPGRVLDDVLDGYVSADAAERLYGVVLGPDGDTVDDAATEARRTELRAGRGAAR